MKILIGGGAGYLGTRLSNMLVEDNYDVTVMDLCWFGNNLNNKIKLIKKNLENIEIEELKNYDQFIFLAGVSNDPMADFNPEFNFASNSVVPSVLAYKCKKAGIKRFIYSSSCSIYGNCNDNFIDEDYTKKANFSYGISKYQGEIGVNNLNDENFSTISLRLGTLSGYSPRMRFDLVLNAMYKNATIFNEITVNNPNIWRPILDIRDACQGFKKAIDCDYSINGSFNLTSENINIQELAIRIKNKMDILLKKNIKLNILNIYDNRNYKVKIEKANNILLFKPEYKIENSIDDIFNNFLDKDNINSFKYINIETFKKILDKNLNIQEDFKLLHNCRICNNNVKEILDLNNQPLANNLQKDNEKKKLYPLKLMLCDNCFHTQLNIIINPDLLFKNYLYVSNTSNTLLLYFKWFVEDLIQKTYNLNNKCVLEIASNDCSLLDIFKKNNWKTYGVDPAENLHKENQNKEHNLFCNYWNMNTSNIIKKECEYFDVIVAQNVFAHLNDVNDFLKGCYNVMNNDTLLFIQTSQKNMFYNNELDTIYHEHVSFFSIKSMKYILEKNNLYIFDIHYPKIHGESYLFCITKNKLKNGNFQEKYNEELLLNRYNLDLYCKYTEKCYSIKKYANDTINDLRNKNKKIIGFGAAAKATVFLNFCNINLDYIVDENKKKQNLYIPGVNLLIKEPSFLYNEDEDVTCIILAWNFSDEIIKKIKENRNNKNDKFITFFPEFKILN